MFGQDDSWAKKDTSLGRRLDKIEKKLDALINTFPKEPYFYPFRVPRSTFMPKNDTAYDNKDIRTESSPCIADICESHKGTQVLRDPNGKFVGIISY